MCTSLTILPFAGTYAVTSILQMNIFLIALLKIYVVISPIEPPTLDM